jgi:hypothetical protein
MLSFGPRTPGVRDRYREEYPAHPGQYRASCHQILFRLAVVRELDYLQDSSRHHAKGWECVLQLWPVLGLYC